EIVSYVDNGLRAELVSVEAINAFIDEALASGSHATKAALGRLDHYETHVRGLTLGPTISDNWFFKTRTLNVRGLNIGIAALNSAWRATGKPGGDKTHLIVGERAIDFSIRDLTKTDIKICVFHHPIDWLSDPDANAIESRIYNSFDLLCLGHTHRQ